MNINLTNEILSIHSYSQTLEFDRTDNVLHPDNVNNSNVETKFNTDNVDKICYNYLEQITESSYFIHSGRQKNEEFNNETKSVMESMPCTDGLHYTAVMSSFSDNFLEIDQELQINQNLVEPINSIELRDEGVCQTSQGDNQQYLYVQEEVQIQEGLELEIISQDLNQSADTCKLLSPYLINDINFTKEIEPIHNDSQALEFHINDNTFCTDGSLGNEEFNNEARSVMESMISADGLLILAPMSSFSDNFMEIDQESQINQNRVELNNLFELSDKGVCQTSQGYNQQYLNVQEVEIQEGSEEEIISWDLNQFLDTEHMKKQLRHTLEEPHEEPHACILCKLSFKTLSKLTNHIKQHSNRTNTSNAHTCNICSQSIEDNKTLLNHLIIYHTVGDKCMVCGKIIPSIIPLKRHMKYHHEKNGKKIANKQALVHYNRSLGNIKNVTQNALTINLFPCLICNKVFNFKSSQLLHMRLHTDKKPYGCNYCVKAFADAATRTKHEQIHTG